MQECAVVDIGTSPPGLTRWSFAEVVCNGFADLPTETNTKVTSPKFTCLGRSWTVDIFPGGLRSSTEGGTSSRDGWTAVYLRNMTDEEIKIHFDLFVKDSHGREKISSKGAAMQNCFPPYPSTSYGKPNFARRSALIEALNVGSLFIGVRMRLDEQPVFVPENPSCNLLPHMFMNEETANIVFEVEGSGMPKNAKRSPKKAKTSPTRFYAHRCILQQCAPQLAELCGAGTEKALVSITDIAPVCFRCLLSYLYGVKVASTELTANARELIDAADKYGISTLKLEAEACFVKSTKINVENAMEHLLYADAMNCSLLKEAVMDFIVTNKVEVLENIALKDAPGGLLADVLAAMARGEKKEARGNDGKIDRLSILSISDLRRKVHKKGLDVDGSRESLIAALKEDRS